MANVAKTVTVNFISFDSIYSLVIQHSFTSNFSAFGLTDFIDRKNFPSTDDFIKDDTIFICCEIKRLDAHEVEHPRRDFAEFQHCQGRLHYFNWPARIKGGFC
jgi:hypothetical protein